VDVLYEDCPWPIQLIPYDDTEISQADTQYSLFMLFHRHMTIHNYCGRCSINYIVLYRVFTEFPLEDGRHFFFSFHGFVTLLDACLSTQIIRIT
jgi:hypothetical protein